MWFLSLWNGSVGGTKISLVMWDTEVLAYCKQSVLGSSSGGTEDQNSCRNDSSEVRDQDDSGGNEDPIRYWTRRHSYYILAKNLSMFCPCPGTLNKSEVKGDELVRHWWIMPVILTTQEAEIRRFTVRNQPRKIVCKTLFKKYTT
jgi:hypothetical protein